jgi:hypothetical protein
MVQNPLSRSSPNEVRQVPMSSVPDNAEIAKQFASVAKKFCDVIESTPNLDRTELLVQIYTILPQLISHAISLPKVEPNDNESYEKLRTKLSLSHAQWSELYQSLKIKLGDANLYWAVWDPMKKSEAIHGSLADDCADIYRDLKVGLDLSGADQAVLESNIWHWRFGYHSHWGKHAIDALRTIYFLLEDHFMVEEPSN